MRAGDHHHLPIDPRGRLAAAVPVGIVEGRTVAAVADRERHRPAVDVADGHVVEIGTDGGGVSHLGHGAVERRAPAGVLVGMTGAAGSRGGVAILGDLNRTRGDGVLGRGAAETGHHRPAEGACEQQEEKPEHPQPLSSLLLGLPSTRTRRRAVPVSIGSASCRSDHSSELWVSERRSWTCLRTP